MVDVDVDVDADVDVDVVVLDDVDVEVEVVVVVIAVWHVAPSNPVPSQLQLPSHPLISTNPPDRPPFWQPSLGHLVANGPLCRIF